MPQEQVLGAELPPARRDVADLVGRGRTVADQKDACHRLTSFPRDQEQMIAARCGGVRETGKKDRAWAPVADLAPLCLVGREQPREILLAANALHLEGPALRLAQLVPPLAVQAAPQNGGGPIEIEPARAVARHHRPPPAGRCGPRSALMTQYCASGGICARDATQDFEGFVYDAAIPRQGAEELEDMVDALLQGASGRLEQ